MSDEDAADALQEALVSAFRKFDTFRVVSSRGWLARAMVNACYDEIRNKSRQQSEPLHQFNLKESILRMAQVGQFQQHIEHSRNIWIPGSGSSMGQSCIKIKGEYDNGSC